MPTLAKFMAMPPPMVPAPITATFSMLRSGRLASMPGMRPASRSAKNTWRSAVDCAEASACLNSSTSRASPCSSGRLQDASTAARTRRGARRLFQRGSLSARNLAKKSAGRPAAGWAKRSAGRAGALSASSSAAKARAESSRVSALSAMRSSRPSCKAREALIGWPEIIMSRAGWAPIRRGRRWVPPAPGSRPRLISGRPRRALVSPMR
ncbi:hypothetical protein D3C78_1054330 [compost metagenome]